MFGTQLERGFAVPLDGKSALPLRLEPVDPVAWIETAVRQKAEKNYSKMNEVVLVVDFIWTPLYEFQLPELAQRLSTAGIAFGEVWVVTEFAAPQRVC